MRSLEAVELGEPLVGIGVLQDVGRAVGNFFQGWDEHTPESILKGADPPALVPREPELGDLQQSAVVTASIHDPKLWDDLRSRVDKVVYDLLWEMYVRELRRIAENHPE